MCDSLLKQLSENVFAKTTSLHNNVFCSNNFNLKWSYDKQKLTHVDILYLFYLTRRGTVQQVYEMTTGVKNLYFNFRFNICSHEPKVTAGFIFYRDSRRPCVIHRLSSTCENRRLAENRCEGAFG